MTNDPLRTCVDRLDSWRAAKLVIDHHGENAWWIAAQRADGLLAQGDMDGQRVWKAILRALDRQQHPVRSGQDTLH